MNAEPCHHESKPFTYRRSAFSGVFLTIRLLRGLSHALISGGGGIDHHFGEDGREEEQPSQQYLLAKEER